MTYRITTTLALKSTYIGFSDYLDSLPFSTIQEKYPEMTEADWNAARVEIIAYVKSRSSLPGVTSFTETFTEDGNGITHVWEWEDEGSYLVWKNLPIHLEMAAKYNLSFVLARRIVDASLKDFFTESGVMDDPYTLVGRYLMGLYHIEHDSIQTTIAETI